MSKDIWALVVIVLAFVGGYLTHKKIINKKIDSIEAEHVYQVDSVSRAWRAQVDTLMLEIDTVRLETVKYRDRIKESIQKIEDVKVYDDKDSITNILNQITDDGF